MQWSELFKSDARNGKLIIAMPEFDFHTALSVDTRPRKQEDINFKFLVFPT